MSTIEIAIRYSQRLEGILERRFGARGRGLHEKLTSVETRLPGDLVRPLHWVATMRNKAVHEEGFQIENMEDFSRTCERLIQRLESLPLSPPAMAGTTPNPKYTAAVGYSTGTSPKYPTGSRYTALTGVIVAVLLLPPILIVYYIDPFRMRNESVSRQQEFDSVAAKTPPPPAAKAKPSPSAKAKAKASPSPALMAKVAPTATERDVPDSRRQEFDSVGAEPSPPTEVQKEEREEEPTPAPQLKTVVAGGVLNGKAISKPAPAYPPIAKAARASGTVTVQVVVDESGRVVSASAAGGHPLLQQAAVAAARQARFSPTLLSGQPVKVSGVITYNFVLE